MFPKHRILYKGDITTCNQYLNFAKNLLLHAYQTGQPVLKRRFADATLIRVELAPAIKQIGRGNNKLPKTQGISTIRIEAGKFTIYMESGFLDLLSSSICSEAAYRPAVLHYTAGISAYIYSLVRPLQGQLTSDASGYGGEQLADGAQSLSAGCAESYRLDAINPCGTKYVAVGSYCDNGLQKKKECQAVVPASNFSGKLRLLVQAQYGSNRGSYELVDAITKTILMASAIISPGYKFSYGLFTTSDYRYFLMRVGSRIEYYPLTLTYAGEALLTVVRGGGLSVDDTKKLEAYALSTATVSSTSIAGSTLDTGGGSPLAYGWHWSWDGSQGDVVVHLENLDTRKYDVTHYRLLISHAVLGGEDVFTEDLSIVSQSEYWPIANGLKLIKPVESELTGVVVPLVNSLAAYPSYTEPMSCTVHAYRSTTDALITCAYTQNFTSRSDVTDITPEYACYDSDAKYMDRTGYGGICGTNNLSIGGYSLPGSIETIAFRETKTEISYGMGGFRYAFSSGDAFNNTYLNYVACNGMTLRDDWLAKGYIQGSHPYMIYKVASVNGAICGSTPTNLYYQFKWFAPYAGYLWEKRLDIINATTERFLELPFNDCAAVYTSVRDHSGEGIDFSNSQSPADKSEDGYVEVWTAYLCGGFWVYVTLVETQVLMRTPQNGSPSAGTGLTDSHTYTAKTVVHKNLAGADTSLQFDEVTATETEPVPAASQVLSNYYDTTSDPRVGTYDEIKSSTSGDAKYSFNDVDYDPDSYPGDSSVGWA